MNSRATILVIDDDYEQWAAASHMLASAGYDVRQAASGNQGLQLIAEIKPDLVLVDAVLPDLDGIEVCRRIKAYGELADIFTMIVVDNDMAEQGQAEELVADGYVIRPIGERELLARVGDQLRIRRAESTLKESEQRYRSLFAEQKRQQEELAESEARFRSVAETASDAIVCVNSEGNIIFANRAAESMFGHLASDIVGQPLGVLIPEKVREPHQQRIRAGTLHLNGMATEVAALRKDGSEFGAELTVSSWTSSGQMFYTAICRDISERKRAEEVLSESEQRYRTLFDGVPIGLYRTTPGGQIIDANQALVQMLGYPDRATLLSMRSIMTYADAQDRARFEARMESSSTTLDFETQFRRYDGSMIWVRDSARAVSDDQGRLLYYEGSLQDTTARREAEQLLRSQSLRDDLTGLYNRRGFMALAEQQVRLAKRQKSAMTVLYFADIDNMKWINDTFGHLEGDQALIAMAAILRDSFHASDIIARLGGDEFVILAIDTAEDVAGTLSARLQNKLDAYNKQKNRRYLLSLSVGTAYYDPQHPCSVNTLLTRADSRMYQEKQATKMKTERLLPRT